METATGSRTAREMLRAYHGRQEAALHAYLVADTKLNKLRGQLDRAETDLRGALGKLADAAGVEFTSQVTGTIIGRVRDALGALKADEPAVAGAAQP